MIDIKDLQTSLGKEAVRRQMGLLYGKDDGVLDFQRSRCLRLSGLFQTYFPSHSVIRVFSTSGRTEIAGNHTDHQRGRVLCAPVDLDILAMVSPNNENIIRIKSEEYDRVDVIDLSVLTPQALESQHSASLIRGIAASLKARGFEIGGFDACTTSRVLKGSGLSSSAAFEVLVATILNFLYNGGAIPSVTIAIACQSAENTFFGKPCGLMDQCACAFGGLMTIDFKTPGKPLIESLPVDFDRFGHALVITNTGGSHSDLTDDYASIPEDMGKVARFFGKEVLRDVSEEEMIDALPALCASVGDKAVLRAMHFFADDKRVALEADALRRGDFGAFLQLVRESGVSSQTLLQNIYSVKNPTEQPVALGLALSARILGSEGACRVHGGGFAGTIQAFVPCSMVDGYIRSMESLFGPNSSWRLRIRTLPAAELALE